MGCECESWRLVVRHLERQRERRKAMILLLLCDSQHPPCPCPCRVRTPLCLPHTRHLCAYCSCCLHTPSSHPFPLLSEHSTCSDSSIETSRGYQQYCHFEFSLDRISEYKVEVQVTIEIPSFGSSFSVERTEGGPVQPGPSRSQKGGRARDRKLDRSWNLARGPGGGRRSH